MAPVDQDFENSALAADGGFRADRGLVVAPHARARGGRPRAEPVGRTSSTRSATRSTGRTTSSSRTANTLTAGSCGRTRKPIVRIRSACRRLRLRHDDEPALPPGPGRLRPASHAARRRLHGPRDLRRPRDLERGIRLRLRRRRARDALAPARRFRAPDATDLYGFRRQPGSRAGGVDELRDRLPPAARRAAVGSRSRHFATTSTT